MVQRPGQPRIMHQAPGTELGSTLYVLELCSRAQYALLLAIVTLKLRILRSIIVALS